MSLPLKKHLDDFKVIGTRLGALRHNLAMEEYTVNAFACLKVARL